jgi:predicted deacetylase
VTPRAAPGCVAVVLHDVAPPTWAACERLRRCVEAVAPVPLTWLAVPRYHGAAREAPFEAALGARLAHGDELALHGLTHRDEGRPRGAFDRWRRSVYTAGEGEFAALGQAEARRRLDEGRAWFEARGWPLHGFVAPAWLASAGTLDALEELGFAYTCSLSRLMALPSRRSLHAQSLVYSTRAAWRRTLSLGWNASVARVERQRPLLRFELHPGDAEHAAVRASWMRLLAAALREREAVTLSQAVQRLLGADAGEVAQAA